MSLLRNGPFQSSDLQATGGPQSTLSWYSMHVVPRPKRNVFFSHLHFLNHRDSLSSYICLLIVREKLLFQYANDMAETELVRTHTNILPKAKLIVVFSGLAFALLISFIDQNSIGIALPTIGADLNSATTTAWAGTSSLIANTKFQVLYGRLSDIVGREVVFLFAGCWLSEICCAALLWLDLNCMPIVAYQVLGIQGLQL